MSLPPSCDGCRHCPSTYPLKGAVVSKISEVQDSDLAWRGLCGWGHETVITVVGQPPNMVLSIQLNRYPLISCTDREEPYTGPRVSRYAREPVI